MHPQDYDRMRPQNPIKFRPNLGVEDVRAKIRSLRDPGAGRPAHTMPNDTLILRAFMMAGDEMPTFDNLRQAYFNSLGEADLENHNEQVQWRMRFSTGLNTMVHEGKIQALPPASAPGPYCYRLRHPAEQATLTLWVANRARSQNEGDMDDRLTMVTSLTTTVAELVARRNKLTEAYMRDPFLSDKGHGAYTPPKCFVTIDDLDVKGD